MSWILLPIILWILILTAILPRKGFYSALLDQLLGGRLRDDKTALSIMLGHLESNPELWSIGRREASFPLDSKAKQIYINYDDDKGLFTYNLAGNGERSRVLDGYYGAKIASLITKENDARQAKMLVRNLYGVDGPLLLT